MQNGQDMPKRVITGAVILIVTLGFVLLKQFHNIIFDVLLLILTYGALFEIISTYKLSGKRVDYAIFLYPALVCLILNLEQNLLYALCYIILVVLLYVIYIFAKEIVLYAKNRAKNEIIPVEERNKLLFEHAKYSLTALAYPLVPMTLFFVLNHLSYDVSYMGIVLSFAISMLTDTFALFIGMAFGKHKLIPEVSPGKTVEGCLGGLFGGLLGGGLCFIFFYFTPYFSLNFSAVSLCTFLIVGIFGSVIDQIGDLIASALKRKVGIKDYGNIFPGHGGFMDRIDGLMFTASLVCIAFVLFLV